MRQTWIPFYFVGVVLVSLLAMVAVPSQDLFTTVAAGVLTFALGACALPAILLIARLRHR